MKKHVLPAILALVLASGAQVQAQTIAQWTFETSAPSNSGTGSLSGISAEVGSGIASGIHASSATAWSAPAGNGSSHSFSSSTWAIGDYYQFQVSTLGYQNIEISWDETSSNTGPKDFELSYSTDGANFTNFASYSVLANATPNTPWSTTGSLNSAYTFTENLSAITALANDSTVYFRLSDTDTTSANGGTVGTGGTDRVDNVTVTGVASAPEPSTWVLGLLGLGLVALYRSRKSLSLSL